MYSGVYSVLVPHFHSDTNLRRPSRPRRTLLRMLTQGITPVSTTVLNACKASTLSSSVLG